MEHSIKSKKLTTGAAAKWLHPINIMLSERSKSQKNTTVCLVYIKFKTANQTYILGRYKWVIILTSRTIINTYKSLTVYYSKYYIYINSFSKTTENTICSLLGSSPKQHNL